MGFPSGKSSKAVWKAYGRALFDAEMSLTPQQRAARTRRMKRDAESVTVTRGELERLRLRERVLSVYRQEPMFNVHGQCINDPFGPRPKCRVVGGECKCSHRYERARGARKTKGGT